MIQEIFIQWKNSTNTFQKLQWAYAVVGVGLIVIAGLISLLDPAFGQDVAMVAWYVFIIFVINFVANAVIANLVGTPEAKTKKK